MLQLLRWIVFLGFIGLAVFWWISRPEYVDAAELEGLTGDVARGERVFYAGGCASCHAAPKAEGADKLLLAGGLEFHSPFGTFLAPNISPHENGIGGWSAEDLVNAMKFGVSPEGEHYYPAFPYTSYVKVDVADIIDLKAFLDTLEPVETESKPHQVGFPFNIRRSLGGWKFLFMSQDWMVDSRDETVLKGRYLVEGLGHCSECHTSRNFLGGTVRSKWLAGGPNPDGPGNIPNITPHETGLAAWSEDDIVEYLFSGFTPEFDVAGGSMTDVVSNTGALTDEDRRAIAAYLKIVPAHRAVKRSE